MFRCKKEACTFHTNIVKLYVSHCNVLHGSGPTSTFICGFKQCPRTFKTFSGFSAHAYRDHVHANKKKSRLSTDAPERRKQTFTCDVCLSQFFSVEELARHIRKHFDGFKLITCPYVGCGKLYNILSSFGAHLSKKHNTKTLAKIGVDHDISLVIADNVSDVTVEHDCIIDGDKSVVLQTCGTTVKEHQKEVLIRELALFYLTLGTKNHVPNTTAQGIYQKYASLMTLTVDMIIQDISKRTVGHIEQQLTMDIVKSVLDEKITQIYGLNGPLSTIYRRKEYCVSNFRFVKPRTIPLGKNELNKLCELHYVPINKSLESLLSDETVYKQYVENCHTEIRSSDVLTDIQDGKAIQCNTLFSNCSSSLQIILYQDEFLVANPLGSCKKKLKMLGVYYTLGNIHPWNRSKVDPLQLILICRSRDLKYFGNDVVFRELIKDLKLIETEGVDVRGERIKGTLAYISGDNLGNHFIGGYVENFSSSQYFCRFCLIQKHNWIAGTNYATIRTKENYHSALENINCDDSIKNVEGIKHNSLFNSLQYYHIVDGMPPCIGHDVFEGIAQYDIPLILKYFITKGWFDLECLNRRIQKFKYCGIDSNDKPCPITSVDKLGGHAVQTWTLIRMLPFLIGDKIQNKEDVVWQMLLLFITIVQLICSPNITQNLVALLHGKIDDYVNTRRQHFDSTPLRPKHHYLYHYPRMIVLYGPLIRVWTMRFESKHKYFKDIIRVAKNTINVTKTLAEKHQYMQAAYSVNGLFDNDEVIMKNGSAYCSELFNEKINRAIERNDDLALSTSLTVGTHCSFRGVEYRKDNLLILPSGIILNALKIIAIVLAQDGNLFFVGRYTVGHLIENLQLYEVEETDTIITTSFSQLQDYHPYCIYNDLGFPAFSLKHRIR